MVLQFYIHVTININPRRIDLIVTGRGRFSGTVVKLRCSGSLCGVLGSVLGRKTGLGDEMRVDT